MLRGTRVNAKNYREVKGQAYTRKEYVRSSPPSKITKFTMGDTKTQFPIEAKLIALKSAQIRHNALEAARRLCNIALDILYEGKAIEDPLCEKGRQAVLAAIFHLEEIISTKVKDKFSS